MSYEQFNQGPPNTNPGYTPYPNPAYPEVPKYDQQPYPQPQQTYPQPQAPYPQPQPPQPVQAAGGVHVVQPMVVHPTVMAPRIYDRNALICGAVMTVCAALTAIMIVVYLVRFGFTLDTLTMGTQMLMSLIAGLLLISGGRGNLHCTFGCTIVFSVIAGIMCLYHVVITSPVFNDTDRYIIATVKGIFGAWLGISILNMVASFCAFVIGCYMSCCAPNQGAPVGSGVPVSVGYVNQGATVPVTVVQQ